MKHSNGAARASTTGAVSRSFSQHKTLPSNTLGADEDGLLRLEPGEMVDGVYRGDSVPLGSGSMGVVFLAEDVSARPARCDQVHSLDTATG